MSGTDAIIKAFKELVATTPYDKITVYEICEKAGVSRKTFYVHFQNKSGIVSKIVYDDIVKPLSQMDDVFPTLVGTPSIIKSLPELLNQNVYKAIYEDREFYSRLCCMAGSIDSPLVDAFSSGIQFLNLKIMDTLGYKAPDWKKDYISYYFAAGNAILIQRWIRGGMTVPPEELAELYSSMSTPFWLEISGLENQIKL